MVKSNSYVLEVGKSGSIRLDTQNKLYASKSQGFLLSAGLKEGMKVLEVGCGSGSMSHWISETIGKKGSLTAIDISIEQIEIASQKMKTNATRFEVWDILEKKNSWMEQFDLVYCRFLLGHLREPNIAIKHMVSYLKEGGMIACEESTGLDSCFCSPASDAFNKMIGLYLSSQKIKGTRSLGVDIFHQFLGMGLQNVSASLFQPLLTTQMEKQLIRMVFQEFAPFAEHANLISSNQAKELAQKLDALSASDCVIGYIRIAQVLGRR